MTGCPSGLLEAPKIEFQWLQQKFRDGGYLMTAGINSKKPGHGYFKMMSQGLLIDHAYAIIDVREHTETGREPVRLVKLRNPWSRFEWNGDYSDHSSKWDPKLRKDLHLCADDNDGVFWMDFGHFRSIFDTFSFCDSRHEWRSIPKSFSFNLQNERVESPRFSFKVPGKMVLKYLSLHQNDKRIKSSPQNYIDLAGFVLKNGEGYFEDQKCVGLLESNIDRNTFSKFKLQTGEYTFVPYSSGSHFGGQNLRDVTVLLHLTPEKSDKIRLKTENGDLKTENGDLKTENVELKTENVELKTENVELKTENVELKTENGELKTENGELKTENGELKTENVELKTENGDLKTENGESEKLVKKLDHNEKAMEKAKLLSLKTMATVMKNDDGVFSLRTVKNGGLVLFGVDNLAEKYANVKFSIDVGASSNLLPVTFCQF